jgi:hypothetical protein
MAQTNYISTLNYEELQVPIKAATVFAAHEASLFLGGALIPSVAAPTGVLRVPSLAATSADVITRAGSNVDDITIQQPTPSKNDIDVDLYASRSVLRDLGSIDANEIGRVLGNAVSSEFDKAVMATIGANTTEQENTETSRDLTVDEVMKAVGTIRATGETGQLFGIVGAGVYAELMKDIGSNAYAGGEFQNTAMRSGFLGNIAGVNMFVSSYLTDTNVGLASHNAQAVVFAADAYRIAMQKNVDVEIARRAESVGFDVVASLHAGVGAIDATRSVLIIDENA